MTFQIVHEDILPSSQTVVVSNIYSAFLQVLIDRHSSQMVTRLVMFHINHAHRGVALTLQKNQELNSSKGGLDFTLETECIVNMVIGSQLAHSETSGTFEILKYADELYHLRSDKADVSKP